MNFFFEILGRFGEIWGDNCQDMGSSVRISGTIFRRRNFRRLWWCEVDQISFSDDYEIISQFVNIKWGL